MKKTQSSQAKSRASLRQSLRSLRRNLSAKQQHSHSRRLAKNLKHYRSFSNLRHIAFYLAEDGEASPEVAIKLAWQQGKIVYLPVISPYANELYFAPYSPTTRMKRNRFGILEPAVALSKCKHAHQLQLIFMPLVGFDEKGNRLGMGGGFYDRSLHFRQHQKNWKTPKLIGLAHECQKLDQVPTEDWDIPVDGIVTEAKFYRF